MQPDPELADFPPPAPAAGRPRRTVPVMAIVALLVAMVGAGTFLLGGFEVAKNRLIRLEPNTEVDLGPMSIAVERARMRASVGSQWTLYVFGRCRNNSDRALSSVADRLVRNAFGAQHPITKEVSGDASMFFGSAETLGEFSVINPGTPMIPCTLVYTFKQFPPTDVVSVGASVMEWIDISPTGDGEMAWSATRLGYRFEVPVLTEPDQP